LVQGRTKITLCSRRLTHFYESDVLLLVVVILGTVFCGIRAETEEIFDGRNSDGLWYTESFRLWHRDVYEISIILDGRSRRLRSRHFRGIDCSL